MPNEVVTLEYRWKSLEDDAEFSNWIDVSDGIVNAGDGTWGFTRTLDTEFLNTSAFKIEVRCKDLLEYCANTKIGDLTTAIALIWRDLENLRFGIGKKPDYKLDVAGDINAEEDINTDTLL